MKRFVLFVLLAFFPCPTFAWSWSAFASRTIAIGGVALDMWTTQRGIDRGGVELNPVLGNSAIRRNATMIGFSGAIILVNEFARKDHPKMANLDEITMGGIHTAVAAHNWRVLRTIQQRGN
jgi:hypothetical protein